MTNRPKAIGTAGETAVVRYLRTHGFPHAERRALAGATDLGDILTPGIVWECKSGNAAANASPGQIAKWMAETLTETQNARADYGVLVCKRAGVGAANAGAWWAYVDSHTLTDLIAGPAWRSLGLVVTATTPAVTVRLQLADVVTVLRHAGYGDPILDRSSA